MKTQYTLEFLPHQAFIRQEIFPLFCSGTITSHPGDLLLQQVERCTRALK